MAKLKPGDLMATTKQLNVTIPLTLKLRLMECAECADQNLSTFIVDALEKACEDYHEILDEYYQIGRGVVDQSRIRGYNNALKKQGQH